jgi:uncharacterized protein YecT (DUF1311 family)
MRSLLGLLLLASSMSAASADPLDDWCAHEASLPSSIAICSDPELRALAMKRQDAFDEARKRVGDTGYGALQIDQKAWVASYPKACGLPSDTAPNLPLALPVRECMARSARARIAYLRAYGTGNRVLPATPDAGQWQPQVSGPSPPPTPPTPPAQPPAQAPTTDSGNGVFGNPARER